MAAVKDDGTTEPYVAHGGGGARAAGSDAWVGSLLGSVVICRLGWFAVSDYVACGMLGNSFRP